MDFDENILQVKKEKNGSVDAERSRMKGKRAKKAAIVALKNCQNWV